MDAMSFYVAVNGISSHQLPPWNKWRKKKKKKKKKRETEKMQRVEAVEAMLGLIVQAKEKEGQARERGDTETVEKADEG
jgi:DNA mitochondrial polymerase exonuclease domain